jgi:hypothetical protein
LLVMDAQPPDNAKAALAEIYRFAFFARGMVLQAQGKPLHEDYPHTAPDTETGANPMDRMLKAEIFLDLAIEKLDTFAKSFGLPNGWWFPDGS